jgi:hypothetical protein
MVAVGLRLNQAKSLFFDRQKIQNAVGRAERRVLSKFGAYVRADARASIRRRKRPSRPWQSPTNQTGRLKNNIFFVFDPARRSVVIGPVLLGRGTGAPEILEYGGVTVVRTMRREPRPRKQQDRQRSPAEIQRIIAWKRKQGRQPALVTLKRITIEPRPYMGPAFEENRLQELPRLWQDAVIKAA